MPNCRKLIPAVLCALLVAGCPTTNVDIGVDASTGATGGNGVPAGHPGSGGSGTTGSGGRTGVGSGGQMGQSSGGNTGSGASTVAGSGGRVSTGGTGGLSSGGSIGSAGATGTGGAGGTSGYIGPCDVFIAPDGNDANPGTQAQPMLTLALAYNRLCPGVGGAQPGDLCSGTLSTMCLKAGTYPMSTRFQTKKERMGAPTRIVTIMADPAATTKPVLDFSSQPQVMTCVGGTMSGSPIAGADQNNHGGIDLISDYYKLKGLEIKGSNGWGISIQGAHDVVEGCDVHDNGDCGISIRSGSGIAGSGSFVTVLNCDSHHNNDAPCQGANADGLCAKEGAGPGNVFDGCRTWDNADDGLDLFAWPDPITVKNSWAFGQGLTTAGSMSNGNGFKMGGGSVSAKHIMSNDFAFDNNETAGGSHVADWGFTNNSNPAAMTCTGCGANNDRGGSFQNIASSGAISIAAATTAKAATAKRNADGSLPSITTL